MQDKETADEAEEALTCKAETISDRRGSVEKKDSFEGSSGRRDSTKDGKFAFKKMKDKPKKEKSDKNSPSRFEGEGVIFKAKLIGVESVPDARGDKMCQDAMQRLKLNVRNTGPHKRKINISVSLQGIKIKDEKFGTVIYHHPVSLISFISQDITDARAFGYVFGSTDEPHQFIAIKTEKPAFHVVLALRDLFQTVLNHKQEEIDTAKESKSESVKSTEAKKSCEAEPTVPAKIMEEQEPKDEIIYFEVLLDEPMQMREDEDSTNKKEPVKTVDDLLGLQNELNKLQEGIDQMDTSIATVAAFNSEVTMPEKDPFDTSFVLGPKRDSFNIPMPTPVPLTSAAPNTESQLLTTQSANDDKYAVFNAIDASPSVFEIPHSEATRATEQGGAVPDVKELEEEIKMKTPPSKPPRLSKASPPDQSVFADLDPLGKDRPYKDKAEFFQDVKNPPKKVLNDLVDPNKETSKAFDVKLLSPAPFPVDFESVSSPVLTNSSLSSSLPNSFLANPKLSLAYVHNGNGENPYNPFEKQDIKSVNPTKPLTSRGSEPVFPNLHILQNNIINNSSQIGKTPATNILGTAQLTVNCNTTNYNHSPLTSQQSSSPIPIPSRHAGFNKDISFSNGSIGSPYSKSPIPYNSESPNHSDYFIQHQVNSESCSPTGLIMKNGMNMHQSPHTNGENGHAISPTADTFNKNNINGFSNSTTNLNSHNGVSRPRPRPSLNKGSSFPNNGHSSNSVSSDSSSDYEAISRENMQSIANVLLTNGHKLRTQSLCLESNNDFRVQLPGEKNIFSKKNDPFADDFFFSLPKKPSHLTKTEIPDYV